MRNPYLAAAGTYRRAMFLLLILPIALWLPMLIMTMETQHLISEMAEPPAGAPAEARARFQADISVPLGRAQGLGTMMLLGPSSFVLVWLGVALSVHLKDMLGNPTSRFMPGLRGAHLALAGVLAGIFTVAVPLAVCVGLGWSGSCLTVVAFALALFTLSAFFIHWLPQGFPALAVGLALFGLVAINEKGHGSSWSPPTSILLLLLAVSIAGLASVALRLARFNEEMVEYHRRMKMTGVREAGLWRFLPVRDLRCWRTSGLPLSDGLVRRAAHWHAARRTIWTAVGIGPLLGCLIAALALFRGFSVGELIGSPNIPYLAVFPVMTALIPQGRRYLAVEVLRPQSRTQYVRGVGLALAIMLLVCWLLLLLTIFAVFLLWGTPIHFPPIGSLWQSVSFSMCCLPLAFGIAVWPARTSAPFFAYSAMFGVMASFALIPLRLNGISAIEWGLACLGLLGAGLLVTRQSYVRWLSVDIG